MSSPIIRRSATVTAGAIVLAGLVAAPIAAFAADPSGLPDGMVKVGPDPDLHGDVYALTQNIRTYTTITMPDGATLDGAGHTITAVEDEAHPTFSGAVLASATGNDTAPATLDVHDLTIATDGFESGGYSNGLTGIYMYRAGGSLTNVTVDGISHGEGNQEGNAIAVRNRVSGDEINVPRAHVTLTNVQVSHYQKTGMLLDGNLSFTVTDATVGQGTGPQGQPNPIIAANSLQISRGASGTVSDSTFALNNVGNRGAPEEAAGTAALLYNAKNVEFDGVSVNGDAADAADGIDVSNVSNTIDTTFTMRGGEVTRTATTLADGTGVAIEGPDDAITATTIDTPITGWSAATSGNVDVTTTPDTPAITKVAVNGTYQATRPHLRRLRLDLHAFALEANQVEGKMLTWRFKVDGRAAGVIREHAGETDLWSHRFQKGTGTHTVEIRKNGVSQHIYRVATR